MHWDDLKLEDLHRCAVLVTTLVEVLTLCCFLGYRPHSSPDPFRATLPSGEGIGGTCYPFTEPAVTPLMMDLLRQM